MKISAFGLSYLEHPLSLPGLFLTRFFIVITRFQQSFRDIPIYLCDIRISSVFTKMNWLWVCLFKNQGRGWSITIRWIYLWNVKVVFLLQNFHGISSFLWRVFKYFFVISALESLDATPPCIIITLSTPQLLITWQKINCIFYGCLKT